MERLKELFVPQGIKILETPTLAFAFLGDAVMTLVVRKILMESGIITVNNLHKTASQFCSATGQAQMLDSILPHLNEEESQIVRRARNTKTHKPPKNANIETYKKATALECLLGMLFAQEKFERIANLFMFGIIKTGEKL